MSAEIIPFDFEEQAVRVVMRAADPWFVAADVCRVLEIGNTTDALRRLDDDETDTVNLNTLDSVEGIRGNPNARVINESGLYALVLTSRKDAARRFRKWITSEVLPSIRRNGRYGPEDGGEKDALHVAGLPIREAEMWLAMVREARMTRGTRAATSIWDRSPLPPLTQLPPTCAGASVQDGQGCLAHLLALLGDVIDVCRAEGSEDASLTAQGMRPYHEALFIANFALSVFEGTKWAKGAHRAALLALPGVHPSPQTRSLSGIATRGLLIPWRLIDGEGV